MAASKEPKTRCSNTMTESAFWSFIRSALRSKSMRWKPIYDAANAATRPYKGSNKQQKKERQCAECGGWFKLSETAVDHIEQCGSLKCADDLPAFVERLFCESDGLRVLCHECHGYVTMCQMQGCTMEEAKAAKPFIEFSKLKAIEQKKVLTQAGITSKLDLLNAETRLEAFKKLKGEINA